MKIKFKIGRNGKQTKMLVRNLCKSLVEKGQITTTVTKAKAMRPTAERLITIAKKNTQASFNRALSILGPRVGTVHTLFKRYLPRYQNRNGGYTRIVRAGARKGDGAQMAIIEYLPENYIALSKLRRKASENPRPIPVFGKEYKPLMERRSDLYHSERAKRDAARKARKDRIAEMAARIYDPKVQTFKRFSNDDEAFVMKKVVGSAPELSSIPFESNFSESK
mgnify:CR=1 FL=1